MSLPASTGRLCAITALVTVFWPSFSSVVHVIVFRTLIGLLKLFEPLVVVSNCIGYSQGRRAFMLEGRLAARESAADDGRRFIEELFFVGTIFKITVCFRLQTVFYCFIPCFSGAAARSSGRSTFGRLLWSLCKSDFRQVWARERNSQVLSRQRAATGRQEAQDDSR